MDYCLTPLAIIIFVFSVFGMRRIPAQWLGAIRDTAAQICLVGTAENEITVHVGPGYNRGIRDYLALNEPFRVIGQATADDGSSWWRIEIPGIDEAWVAEQDVIAVGACATVTGVDAPPIVPAVVAPPSETVEFPVYNCVHVGGGVFEWYSAEVTYQDGAIVEENITGGPFRGQWQTTCPAVEGQQPSGGDPAPPPADDDGPAPTPAPSPTPGTTLGGGTVGDDE